MSPSLPDPYASGAGALAGLHASLGLVLHGGVGAALAAGVTSTNAARHNNRTTDRRRPRPVFRPVLRRSLIQRPPRIPPPVWTTPDAGASGWCRASDGVPRR